MANSAAGIYAGTAPYASSSAYRASPARTRSAARPWSSAESPKGVLVGGGGLSPVPNPSECASVSAAPTSVASSRAAGEAAAASWSARHGFALLRREPPALGHEAAGLGVVELVPLALELRGLAVPRVGEHLHGREAGRVGEEEGDEADVVEEAGEKGERRVDAPRFHGEGLGGDRGAESMSPQGARPRAGDFPQTTRARGDEDVARLAKPDGDHGLLERPRRAAPAEEDGVGDADYARGEADVGADHAAERFAVHLGILGDAERGGGGGRERGQRLASREARQRGAHALADRIAIDGLRTVGVEHGSASRATTWVRPRRRLSELQSNRRAGAAAHAAEDIGRAPVNSLSCGQNSHHAAIRGAAIAGRKPPV